MTFRRRLATATLSSLLALGLAASAADAGGAMGTAGSTATCRMIQNGVNPPQTVEITDPLTSPSDVVRVGAAVLLCDLAATGSTLAPGPSTVPITTTPNAVTCYQAGAAEQAKIPATINDGFGTQSVKLGGIQLLCVISTVTFP